MIGFVSPPLSPAAGRRLFVVGEFDFFFPPQLKVEELSDEFSGPSA